MDDGSTARQHAEAYERQTGKPSPELSGPELPNDVVHLWRWFLDLHARRGSNGFGGNPLTWSDILAWVMITQPGARVEEVRVLLALDNAWMAQQAEEALQREQTRKATSRPPGSPGRR